MFEALYTENMFEFVKENYVISFGMLMELYRNVF